MLKELPILQRSWEIFSRRNNSQYGAMTINLHKVYVLNVVSLEGAEIAVSWESQRESGFELEGLCP